MKNNTKNFTREHLLYLKKARTRNILVHVTQVGILLLILAIWELAAHLGWIDVFIMSCPRRIWLTLVEISQGGTLWSSSP